MYQVDLEIQALLTDKSAFPASIAPCIADYLYSLILENNPLLVVEIGCCKGFSTLHIGKALHKLGDVGRLWSFDLAPQEAEVRIRRAGLDDIVEFIAGNSAREGKRHFAAADQCIDFLFIDGDHTRRGCFRDAEVFLPHLKIGGILVLHDIYPDQCGWLGPRYLIEYLKRAKDAGRGCYSVEEISDFDQFGIAVCKKQAEHQIKSPAKDRYKLSRMAQFTEIANFEGKLAPWEICMWGISKWRRITRHL